MPTLNKGSDQALYLQLISYLRHRLQDGTLPLGAQVPTELELANQFNVSRGTVRQAMMTLVNEGLLERVRGRGTFVRALPTRIESVPNKRIGVLLSHYIGEMDLLVLIGVENAAKLRNYQISFACTEENQERQTQDIARLLADQVAGLVIFPIRDLHYDDSLWGLRSKGIPFVLVDRFYPDLESDRVTTDNQKGAFDAIEHLIRLGHTRIGFIHSYQGSLNTTSVRDRHLGYQQALAAHGIPYDDSLIYQEPPPVEGVDSFAPFLTSPNRPSAIFASTDGIALIVMQSAQRLGLRIPQDLALVGFDDLRFTSNLMPRLTTVAQPFVDIGLWAAKLLMSRIEGYNGPFQHMQLEPHLVVRESCGSRLRLVNTNVVGAVPNNL